MSEAKSRTLDLFGDNTPTSPEPEEVTEKVRKDFDAFEELERAGEPNGGVEQTTFGGLSVRVAKFKNGKRGLQITRGDPKNPQFSSTVVITPFEYVELARCIFRDSQLVLDLAKAKTDAERTELIEKIIQFCKS